MTMVFRRKKQRFSGDRLGGRDEPVSTDVVPQSRMVLMTFEDRIPLTAQLTARAGFQGMKLSNRVANATSLDNDERLRMRDWFMPRATVIWSPKANVDLMIDYRESLTGYGETGRTGPMAMTREEFRAWSRNFRPERHSRLRFDAEWRPSTDLDLAVTAFQGRIDNRMLFIDRGYLPVNGGSANLQGATISIRHRLSSRWHWSMRYGATQLNRTEGGRATEQGMTVQAGWSSGPWSASLSGTRSSQAALLHEAAGSRGPMHIEGALRYEIAGFDRMPLNVSLRLTDLSQLAGDKLLRHDLSGIAPATDHARGLMLNVGCSW
ncbi:porin family protein [Sphingobium chungbukense]|nr:TonB-dependent receptor [Sphingobium chungbukense]